MEKTNINKIKSIKLIKNIKSDLEEYETQYLNNLKEFEKSKNIIQKFLEQKINQYKNELNHNKKILNESVKFILTELNQKNEVILDIQDLLTDYEKGSRLSNKLKEEKKNIDVKNINYGVYEMSSYHKSTFAKIYRDHFKENRLDLVNLQNVIDNLILSFSDDSYFKIYLNLLDKEYEIKMNNLTDKLTVLQDKMVNEYKEEENQLFTIVKERLLSNYNNQEINNYIIRAMQYDIKEEFYSNPICLPDFIKLGYIKENISSKNRTFNNLLNDIYDLNIYKESYMKLPYCQSLKDGISLYIKTISKEKKKAQDFMRYIIMKLFLTIPAGKLEATFIDPLELGETFSIFSKLADEDKRIIDTRIWSKKEDINEKISTFRQVLETRTQDYGINKKNELLKNESVKLLAITDFPNGFSAEALANLQAIIRKSTDYGVVVLISGEEIPSTSMYTEIRKEVLDNLTILDMTSHQSYIINETEKYRFEPEVDSQLIEKSSYYINEINKKISIYDPEPVHFKDLFDKDIDDPNNWRNNITLDGISIPIGIKGADSVLKLNLGVGTAHHVLIAGQTGGGKTTLLHTIIMSMLLKYSADELQLYLADFKEGIEFKPYTELKCNSFKVIAIDSEREFGLNILEKLCRELKNRTDIFSQNGCTDITEYRTKTKNKMPKIVLIFDEIHELLVKDDDITNKSLQCLNKLITQGRALGIHLILACQDFRLAYGISSLFSQIAVRIAIKGDEESAGSILSSNNDGFKSLSGKPDGSALYNERNGASTDNVYFRVAYLEKNERINYLQTISFIEQSLNPNEEIKTKVLLSKIEDDYFSEFNQFIMNDIIKPISKNNDSYGMIVGENFKIDGKFCFEFTTFPHSNLLLIGNNEETAYSFFQHVSLSALYEELSNQNCKKNNELIDIVDCSSNSKNISEISSDFEFLSNSFHQNQVKRIMPREFENFINILYERFKNRKQNQEKCNERIFFMVFGIDKLHKFKEANPYQKSTLLNKFIEIIDEGSQYGINVIIWAKNISAVKSLLGDSILSLFSLRVLLDGKEKEYEELVHEYDSKSLNKSISIFLDVDDFEDNIHFRVYKNPSKKWVTLFSQKYKNYEND